MRVEHDVLRFELGAAADAVLQSSPGVLWTGEAGCGLSTLIAAIRERLRFDDSVEVIELSPRSTAPESLDALSLAALARGGRSAAGRLVVLIDDMDGLDELALEAVLRRVTDRAMPATLLATSHDQNCLAALRARIVRRHVAPFDAHAALSMLYTGHGFRVAPHVASALAARLGGNPACLVELAHVLTPDQLSGLAMLPDPLPATPTVSRLAGTALGALDPEERRILLIAAVSVDGDTEVLLQACGTSIDRLLRGRAVDHLALVSRTYTMVDERMRALVHERATLAERTEAHAALHDAYRAQGDPELAAWHGCLSAFTGGGGAAGQLLPLAERALRDGDPVRAFAIAREMASRSNGAQLTAAETMAARAALLVGCLAEALHWARRALHAGDPGALAPYLLAVRCLDGRVADEVVESFVPGSSTDTGPTGRTERASIVEAAWLAFALHAESDDADGIARARRMMARVVRREDRQPPIAVFAEAWATLLGSGSGSGSGRAGVDEAGEALSTLAAARHRLSARFGGAGAPMAPLVAAAFGTAEALVEAVRGKPDEARATLMRAAFEAPLAAVGSGLGIELGRLLDLAAIGGVSEPIAAAAACRPLAAALPPRVAGGIRVARGPHGQSTSGLSETGAIPAARESTVAPTPGGELPETWIGTLTPREADVAELVVRGLSNREVADALHLSVRTVEVHLGRVFQKLDARSRTELAYRAHVAAVR